MKLTLVTILVLSVAVVVRSQQPVKPAEPNPHAEHSPGNPPPPPPQPGAPQPNANAANSNSTSNAGGNTLTNQSVPKPENAPKAEPPATGETKPKAEPPADHEHEHSPGNPKHLDNMGGSAGDLRAAQFVLMITAIAPFLLTMLAL